MTKKIGVLIFFFFTGVLGFLFILHITPFGLGISPDSLSYLAGARHIISKSDFILGGYPVTHFPPFYPWLLGIVGFFSNDLLQTARWLNALLFALNAFLLVLAVYWSTGRNLLAAVIALLFFISTASFLRLHVMVWSEPLFFTFTLGSVILLAKHAREPSWLWFIASSVSLGLATVTRYVGFVFVPAALVIVFLFSGAPRIGIKLRDTFIWALVACIPLGLVLIRNELVVGSFANRHPGYHPIAISTYLRDLGMTLGDFLAPGELYFTARLALASLSILWLLVFTVFMLRKQFLPIQSNLTGTVLPLICLMFSLSYLIFLFFSITFLDGAIPVDERLLSPILVLMIVGVLPAVKDASQMLEKKPVWWSFLALVVISIAIKTSDAAKAAEVIQNDGLGYTARVWRESQGVAFVAGLNQEIRIYSNAWDGIGFLTGKQIISIPSRISATSRDVNPRYDDLVKSMCEDILKNHAILVFSNLMSWRWYFPSQSELEKACPLPVLHQFSDGIVYGFR